MTAISAVRRTRSSRRCMRRPTGGISRWWRDGRVVGRACPSLRSRYFDVGSTLRPGGRERQSCWWRCSAFAFDVRRSISRRAQIRFRHSSSAKVAEMIFHLLLYHRPYTVESIYYIDGENDGPPLKFLLTSDMVIAPRNR